MRLRYGSSPRCSANCVPERAMVSLRGTCLHAVKPKARPSEPLGGLFVASDLGNLWLFLRRQDFLSANLVDQVFSFQVD